MEPLYNDYDKDICDKYEVGTKNFEAAHMVNNINELENIILKSFNGSDSLIENQRSFIKHLGITLDGKAYMRVLDGIRQHYR